ncbi:MFS transporter [Streptomyces sp. NPDC048411]|uniref:MFS transporter n=1 Tax=Streptomyces sp. NPDC048411 TaxID=3157206 RepID=UPI003454BDF0
MNTLAPARPTAAARRSRTALLAQWTLACSAVWALLTVLPLHLTQNRHVGVGAAAALVTEAALSLRLMRIVAGPALARLSPAAAIRCALLLGGASFVGLALCDGHPVALAVVLPLIGLGFGMNALALKLIATAAPPTEHATGFAAQAVAVNVGMALGPLAGVAVYHAYGVTAFFLAAALAHAAALFLVLAVRSPGADEAGTTMPLRTLLPVLVRDRGLRVPLALTAAGFVLYTQLFATLPLYVSDGLGRTGLLGTVFLANGALIVVLQMPLMMLVKRWRLSPVPVSLAGFGCFAAAFGCLGAGRDVVWLFIGVVLATFAEMLLMPSLDVLIGSAGPPDRRVAYFSLAALATALGEAVGSFTGVSLAGTHASGATALYLGLAAASGALVVAAGVRRAATKAWR